MRQEARELVHQDVLDLISLLDLDADAHGIDARLDQDFLIVIPRHGQWVEQNLWRARGLDFRHIVPLGSLRGEVGEG